MMEMMMSMMGMGGGKGKFGGKGKWGCGKGDWGKGKKGKGDGFGGGAWGVEPPKPKRESFIIGVPEAVAEAMEPFQEMEVQWSPEETRQKIIAKLERAVSSHQNEERLQQRGSVTFAKVFIDDFVETIMNGLTTFLSDREWFHKVDFSGPILATILYCCKTARIFHRTLAPMIHIYVQESIATWREEERLAKVTWEVLEVCGVKDAYRKKANKHLMISFDDAHLKAPYGQTIGEHPAMAMVKDFVKGWMDDFVGRAWDIIENGTSASNENEQVLFVTVLFQHLCDPQMGCIPKEVVDQLEGGLPPSPWPYIASVAQEFFVAIQQQNAQHAMKKARKDQNRERHAAMMQQHAGQPAYGGAAPQMQMGGAQQMAQMQMGGQQAKPWGY